MTIKRLGGTFTALMLCVFVASCGKPADESVTAPVEPSASAPSDAPVPGVDYQSFANISDFRTKHVSLALTVDFDARQLRGTATLEFDRIGNAETMILDSRGLTVNAVSQSNGGELTPTTFEMGATDPLLGQPLSIEISKSANRIVIDYATSPDASGLQWLTPAQTAGKEHPFLFSQAQPIHARSFIPLQDTPGVRVTYDATIRTPETLRAVMSADNEPERSEDGVYKFSMPQAIPSYLIALAVGDIDFKPMGARTGVYAERYILDAAAAEFADTEAMLERTEQAYGAYRWDRYDLLILPPSFPFGGMENPRLSFITPTVIAGDKSLVALIAHELAHSWSGNLVTNSSWRDLWLNEGFTTYLTNRIMQFVFGDERYEMEMALGYADLLDSITSLDAPDEILALDIRGRDPDEAFSSIPYEKGALFLFELEQLVGREAFDSFLNAYFDAFKFKSIHTEDFLAYLDETLLASHAEALDRDRILEWLYEPGLPDGAPMPKSDAFAIVDQQRDAWLATQTSLTAIETDAWTFHEWKHFLDGMPTELSPAQLTALDEAFELTTSTNNEIAFSWLRIAVRNGYAAADARLVDFLTSIGRNKFLRPLYQDLVDADRREEAQRIFESAKAGYHPLTVRRNSLIVYEDAGD